MIDDERFSQDAIQRLTPIEPSADLRRMVAQIPIENPKGARSLWPFANFWLPSLSMAAVAVFGLFLGRSWEESDPGAMASAPAVESATDERSDGVDNKLAGGEESPLASLEADDTSLDSDLEDLLVLATAGDFSADDWDLSRDAEIDPLVEGTF